MTTLLSVIIPCYNHGQYIKDAIASVKEVQTKYGYEIIVVNDGSTEPRTLEIFEKIEDETVRVIHQSNQGLAAARNNGIAAAKGKYILPLDSDNKVHSNYLTKAVSILESNPAVDVVYANPVFFGDQEGAKEIAGFDIAKMLRANYIDACAVYRKEIWKKVGGYDGNMPAMGNEDWEFWINIYFHGGTIVHLNEVGFYYRTRSDSMSVTTTRPGGIANRSYVYCKHAERIVNLYIERKKILDYVNTHRTKAIVKLLIGRKF